MSSAHLTSEKNIGWIFCPKSGSKVTGFHLRSVSKESCRERERSFFSSKFVSWFKFSTYAINIMHYLANMSDVVITPKLCLPS